MTSGPASLTVQRRVTHDRGGTGGVGVGRQPASLPIRRSPARSPAWNSAGALLDADLGEHDLVGPGDVAQADQVAQLVDEDPAPRRPLAEPGGHYGVDVHDEDAADRDATGRERPPATGVGCVHPVATAVVPDDQHRRPPVAVALGLVPVAAGRAGLVGAAVAHERQPGRRLHPPHRFLQVVERTGRGQGVVHHVVDRFTRVEPDRVAATLTGLEEGVVDRLGEPAAGPAFELGGQVVADRAVRRVAGPPEVGGRAPPGPRRPCPRHRRPRHDTSATARRTARSCIAFAIEGDANRVQMGVRCSHWSRGRRGPDWSCTTSPDRTSASTTCWSRSTRRASAGPTCTSRPGTPGPSGR